LLVWFGFDRPDSIAASVPSQFMRVDCKKSSKMFRGDWFGKGPHRHHARRCGARRPRVAGDFGDVDAAGLLTAVTGEGVAFQCHAPTATHTDGGGQIIPGGFSVARRESEREVHDGHETHQFDNHRARREGFHEGRERRRALAENVPQVRKRSFFRTRATGTAEAPVR